MTALEPQMVDLLHLDRPRVISSWIVDDVVVDPGPASCLAQLLPHLERRPPRAVALTHIHLDHAGAAGSLAERFPEMEVWVHERGAPHMADPSRLLASATRLYGEHMERLWGEFLPVPEERLRVLSGGETIGDMRVAYTPGHAKHHVAYLHEPTGWAFTGDVAGVRIHGDLVLLPTPPPDIDLEAWRESVAALEAWNPRRLALAHFGSYADVGSHLRLVREGLDLADRALELGEEGYVAALRDRAAREAGPAMAGAYGQALPPEQSWQGILRYLQRREQAAGAS